MSENETPAVMDVHLPNDLGAIGDLAERIEAFCEERDIALPVVFQLNLAIDELATNVISYGWDDPGPHLLHIRLSCWSDRLTVVLEDDGRPFNPLDRPPPDLESDLEDRAIGGLGIHLVKEFATDLAYERVGTRNRLTITKVF